MVRLVPQEQSSEWICWQIVDFGTPRVVMPCVKVLRRFFVDVPVPHISEEIVDVVSLVPQYRVQQRFDEQFVDVPLLQIRKDIVEEFKNCTTRAIVERICEQIVDDLDHRWRCLKLFKIVRFSMRFR